VNCSGNESSADGYTLVEVQIKFQPVDLCYVSETTKLFEQAAVEGSHTRLAEFDIDCPSSDTSSATASRIRKHGKVVEHGGDRVASMEQLARIKTAVRRLLPAPAAKPA
jgi:hypothetical protein